MRGHYKDPGVPMTKGTEWQIPQGYQANTPWFGGSLSSWVGCARHRATDRGGGVVGRVGGTRRRSFNTGAASCPPPHAMRRATSKNDTIITVSKVFGATAHTPVVARSDACVGVTPGDRHETAESYHPLLTHKTARLQLFLPPHPLCASCCLSRTTRSPQTTVCLPVTLVVFAIHFSWSLVHLGFCNDPASPPSRPLVSSARSRPLVSSACIGASSKTKVTTRSLSAILPRSQSHRHTCLPRCFRMPLPDTHTLLPFPLYHTHTHIQTEDL
jgi:hypothetical protein